LHGGEIQPTEKGLCHRMSFKKREMLLDPGKRGEPGEANVSVKMGTSTRAKERENAASGDSTSSHGDRGSVD